MEGKFVMSYLTKRTFLLFCLFPAIMILNSCGLKDREIKIGFAGNLTGRNSELGVSGRNGVRLAIDEINKAGGIKGVPVKLIVKDDNSHPDMALRADKELISEGVIAIIGHMTSGAVKTAIPYLNKTSTILLSPTVSAESLSGIDDNFIRVIPSNKFQARLLAEAALGRNIRRLAVLYDSSNSTYSNELVSYFLKLYKSNGGKITSLKAFSSYRRADLRQLTASILKTRPEAVLSIAAGADNAMLCQQLEIAHSKIPVFAGMWSMTDDLITFGGRSVERILLPGILDGENEGYKIFRNKYLEKFGKEPTFSSVYSYEAAHVLFDALNNSDASSGENLKNAIAGHTFKGVQESFSINNFGDTERKYYLFSVIGKDFVRVSQ